MSLIPVDDDFRIDLQHLKERIRQDRAAGLKPACIIGNAGTVNTGAIDALDTLADIAAAEGLWLHVDGAFGACAALSENSRRRVAGLGPRRFCRFRLAQVALRSVRLRLRLSSKQ